MNQFRSSVALVPLVARRIQRVLRDVVPRLADFTLAYVAEGVAVTCVASAHVTRDGGRVLRALARAHRIKRSDKVSSVAQVIRTGRPLLRTTIRIAARVDGGEVADLHRQLAPRSALAVPIACANGICGALSLCYSDSGRTYTPQDIPAAMQVAGEIGRLLSGSAPRHGTLRLRPAARDPRQGTTFRRRVAPRN